MSGEDGHRSGSQDWDSVPLLTWKVAMWVLTLFIRLDIDVSSTEISVLFHNSNIFSTFYP